MENAGNASVAEISRAVGLADNYDAWRREVQEITASKKTLQYVPDPYRKVTNAHVKRKEVEYNPIT